MTEPKKTPKATKETAKKTLFTSSGEKVKKGCEFTCTAKDKAHFKKNGAI